MTNKKEAIAGGMDCDQWVELLCTPKAKAAAKALAYYDGDQYTEMVKLLSDPNKGRKSWQERGIIPRFRNVVKAVVEKSGRLFKDQPPVLNVFLEDGVTEDKAQTLNIYKLLNNTEWNEVFVNIDIVTRLLKTSLLLVQWNEEEQRLAFDILHRGNTAVVLEANSRRINSLIYRTSDAGDVATYRIITNDQYIDLLEENSKVSVVGAVPNPYGIVPVVEFYDVQIPRSGYWVDGGQDLVALNEMINLHYTDAEYAISWAKLPTLFTNCRFEGGSADQWESVMTADNKLPRLVPTAGSVIGGPSRAIQLDSAGVDSPFVKYESPKVDISPMDAVVEGWMKQYAADWSVNIHLRGEGRAQSGFQLVVEEVDNLDLRKQRQRMFESGFKRFFQVIKKIVPGMFSDDSILFAEFLQPVLPVNTLESEQSWSIRIAEKRATPIDYFVQMCGLSEKEAIDKWEGVLAFHKKYDAAVVVTEENVPTVSADDSNAELGDTNDGKETPAS